MQIPYGTSAYRRNRGNLPSLELVNMFVEQSRTDQKGVILQSRKALVEVADIGAGPIVKAPHWGQSLAVVLRASLPATLRFCSMQAATFTATTGRTL